MVMYYMKDGNRIKLSIQEETAINDERAAAAIKSTAPRDYNLSPRQFNHMAALAGYDDAIDAILAALKGSNRALYAEIKAGVVGSLTFHFDKVEAVITNPAVSPLIPAGVDATKATLTKNWLAAKDY